MEFFGAEDEARTRDLNLGKVALYQLSYFRIFNPSFLIGAAKIRQCKFPEKFFLRKIIGSLFILRSIQGIPGNFYVGLALIAVYPQAIRRSEQERYDDKYFQVEQEYGRIDPAIRNVFQLRVLEFYRLIC
jgi:hypothetical protein